MSPDEYCQQKTVQSGSSFYYSFLFLPPERRRAITALYAFCREVDDTVDETSDSRWRASSWPGGAPRCRHVQGHAHPPGDPGPAAAPGAYDLQEQHLQAIIDGMEMDLDQSRYLDYPGLRKYCWHVAGVVGILSASIFGVTNPQTLQYAEKLGLAFQLTNIIRDVGDDARKGRIYLPVNELQQFGVTAADILNFRHSDKFEALMKFQADRAQPSTTRRSPCCRRKTGAPSVPA
jgi:phytoene synthase